MEICLKALNEIDPLSLVKYANDEKISKYLKDDFPYPYTLDDANRFIEYTLSHQLLNLGIVIDGECVGCIGVTFHQDIYRYCCEIGYWLASQYWNKGIMSLVIERLCYLLFNEYNVYKITAQVFNENIGSMKVLEKCGFHKEGYLVNQVFKNNRFYDIVLYGKLKEDIYED